MAGLPRLSIDLQSLRTQFEGLQGRHPGLWPILPRMVLLASIVAVIMAVAFVFYWQSLLEDLDRGRQQEAQLRTQYTDKMRQAINMETLRKQKELVTLYVSQLEKQLPSKAEMDALLSDISQAGVGRGLQFELFKPGSVVARDYYAELPINLRLVGAYHDLGAFTSDLSNLPRIVTLHNLSIQYQEKTGRLTMEAVAKTFRYLDAEEVAAQRAAKPKSARQGAAR
jgi:type IV pilus assembly protein PilO